MSRKQTQASIDRIFREFPEMRELYDVFSRTVAPSVYGDAEIDVRVQVKRADPTFMYWQASSFGGGSRSGHMIDFTRNLYGMREEWGVIYDLDRKRSLTLVADPEGANDGNLLSVLFAHGALYKRCSNIAVVSHGFWYDSEPDQETGQFNGALKRVEAVITIYKAPKSRPMYPGSDTMIEGWAALAEDTDVFHNVQLHGATMFSKPDFDAAWYRDLCVVLSQHAQNFQRLVWHKEFGKIVDSSRSRGMSGMFGDVMVMSYIIAGRLRIQLERGNVSFTIAAEDNLRSPRMGFGSVDGTVDEVAALVDDAIIFWLAADTEARQKSYGDDHNVGIG